MTTILGYHISDIIWIKFVVNITKWVVLKLSERFMKRPDKWPKLAVTPFFVLDKKWENFGISEIDLDICWLHGGIFQGQPNWPNLPQRSNPPRWQNITPFTAHSALLSHFIEIRTWKLRTHTPKIKFNKFFM